MANLVSRYRAWRILGRRRADAAAKASALRSIRAHLMFFGYDVSGWSDDELVRGVVKFQRTLYGMGLTVDEAASALRRMSEAANE